jgi:DNA-binding XRE family transcriptional regulator
MLNRREKFSPAQCRAARALLDWPQEGLAERARLEAEAVALYEAGDGELSLGEAAAIGRAFNAAGVIPIRANLAGEGVRFNRADPWASHGR